MLYDFYLQNIPFFSIFYYMHIKVSNIMIQIFKTLLFEYLILRSVKYPLIMISLGFCLRLFRVVHTTKTLKLMVMSGLSEIAVLEY
jgi:hypothetical protein